MIKHRCFYDLQFEYKRVYLIVYGHMFYWGKD